MRSWGGEARRLEVAKDDPAAIAKAAEQGLRDHDLLVVIGGASVGDHDHARPALMRLGLELAVEKSRCGPASRPGSAARRKDWFGLARQSRLRAGLRHAFLRPLLEAMLGRDPLACVATRKARLTHALPANGGREHYLRGRLESDGESHLTVRAFEDQDSSLISISPPPMR